MKRPYKTIDVFPSTPFSGNPLAVVFDADGLTTEQMQQITRWINLSETTFLLPPTSAKADYRVRIFTQARELPFAGHPTVGTCHAWLEAGGKPRGETEIVQECGAGLVSIRQGEGRLAFAAPPIIRGGPVEKEKLEELAQVLRIERTAIVDSQWVDNGPGWVAVMLDSADAVLRVEPLKAHAARHDIGLVGLYPRGAKAAYEVRAVFSDQHGSLLEDPVTGSLNASIAQWLLSTGRVTAPYVASQGARVGRAGLVYIDRDAAGAVWVGGRAATHVYGTFSI